MANTDPEKRRLYNRNYAHTEKRIAYMRAFRAKLKKGLRKDRGGISGTATGSSWKAAWARCFNPKDSDYPRYAGRGIMMCVYIKESPVSLLNLIGERPENKSIDRIDSDGHYSCGSCAECLEHGWLKNIRWATRIEQCRNRRYNRLVTIGNETLCVADWVERSGIDVNTFRNRLRRGWVGEKLLSTVQSQYSSFKK